MGGNSTVLLEAESIKEMAERIERELDKEVLDFTDSSVTEEDAARATDRTIDEIIGTFERDFQQLILNVEGHFTQPSAELERAGVLEQFTVKPSDATNSFAIPTMTPTEMPSNVPTYTPTSIPAFNNEPPLIIPTVKPSTTVAEHNAVNLTERQPSYFPPPKQPPPDRDKLRVGTMVEGFCALSEGAGGKRLQRVPAVRPQHIARGCARYWISNAPR